MHANHYYQTPRSFEHTIPHFQKSKTIVLENNIISSFKPSIYCDIITRFFFFYYIRSWKKVENNNITANYLFDPFN